MTRRRARKGATIEERLRLHMIEAPSGCWIWVGHVSGSGHSSMYGRFQLGGRALYAHRVSYETFVGPIPDGLKLDHLCRRTRCIRPAHLQPVTHSMNVLRGTSPCARGRRRTHCRAGHSYAETAIFYGSARVCAVCNREKAAEWHERNRERSKQSKRDRYHRLKASA